jgi:glycosyltransferase involved in cell wall biosynthesis
LTTDSGRVGVGVYEAGTAAQATDFSSASVWRQTVLLDGVPVERVDFASPGSASPRLVDALLTRRAHYWIARRQLFAALCERFGLPAPDAPTAEMTVSVAVCTHGRPAYLPRLFDALAKLDPAPVEVIIVDNHPGDKDCRAEVEARGFTYVREDRKGLDNARNAAIRVAQGELVAFTDDDCVPVPGWLRALPRLFADPGVAAVTGPMFPYELETRSQQGMETIASMVRGYQDLSFDWLNVSVVHGGAIGVGANMTFRRSALEQLGSQPFPPELDAGTPTESGGDTYVFGRLMALNHRLLYSPEVYGFHEHRRDEAALERAVFGYGAGVSSAMTRLLLKDGEFEVWRGWAWLAKQFLRTTWRWLSGRSSPREVRLSSGYLRGGIVGPWRWLKAVTQQRRLDAQTAVPLSDMTQPPTAAPPVVHASASEGGRPELTVVIPSGGYGLPLRECLVSLATQTLEQDRFEVIVIDDRPAVAAADGEPLPEVGRTLRVLKGHGRGASSARNLGAEHAAADIVLFLDDDMAAAPDLLERHLARHGDAGRVAVVGSYPPAPVDPGLAANLAALWWSSRFTSLERGGAQTWAWMLSGNLSVPRADFLAIGGFINDFPHRREDYELGFRWISAGHQIVYAPEATAEHRYRLESTGRLRALYQEGRGDVVIARTHPGTAGALPLIRHRPLGRLPSPRRTAHLWLRTRIGIELSLATLALLERLKLRGAWMRLFAKLDSATYAAALQDGGFSPEQTRETLLDFEISGRDPLPPISAVTPTLRVTHGGRELFRARRENGLWDANSIRDLIDRVPGDVMMAIGVSRGWLRKEDLRPRRRTSPNVLVRDLVTIGDASEWRELIDSAEEEFVAIIIGDQQLQSPWLEEALVAFDGDRVGAVFGRSIDMDLPTQALFLYGRTFRPSIHWSNRPSYMVFRTAALKALTPEALRWAPGERLAFGFSLLTVLLENGWTVGRRDVHGMHTAVHPGPAAIGRAWVEAELGTVAEHQPKRAARTGVKVVTRAISDLRISRGWRRLVIQEASGSLRGVCAALRDMRREARAQSASDDSPVSSASS